MQERLYLNALLQRRSDLAENAVAQPTGKSEYDYGYAAGVYRGISVALELFKEQLRDEKDKDL